MKKIILILLFGIFILTGCGTDNSQTRGQNDPTATTGLFITYIEREEYDNVKSLFNKDAENMYGDIRLKEFHEAFTKKDGVMTNDVNSVEIVGDTATVPIYWTDYSETVNYKINLIKESDGWLIQSISEY